MLALVQANTYQSVSAMRPLTSGVSHGAAATSEFMAGEEIYAQGERASALYEIHDGAVRLYRLLSDGRRQVVAFYFAGETFGFETDGVHGFFAEAISDTSVRKIMSSANTNTSPQVLALALRGMVRAQRHLLVVGRQCAQEKLGAFLLDLSERQGEPDRIDLPMSRVDIGDYLGLTIETVSRSFSKLKAAGIIRLHGTRSVELVKPEKLRRMCQ